MFVLIYNVVIRLYSLGVRIAAFWNPKAKLWIEGRKDIIQHVRQSFNSNGRQVVWMHSSSLGEFEQGRFLLENIRMKYPDSCIVITFFSPSGYEVSKNYKGADYIYYLPLPTKKNARRFIDIIQPKLVLWIKYDYWYHYLLELKSRNTPVLLISAIFHKYHPFFRWYGPLHRKMLGCFTWIFVQSPESQKRLSNIGFSDKVSVNGDTRFDRVIDIAGNFTPIPNIEEFCGRSKVIVAGSTWPEDEEELDHYANTHPEIKFIIAPHEIEEDHLKDVEKLFHYSVRYSNLKTAGFAKKNTLIIDNIGMLSRLYHYATIAYVGGAFGNDGVHNVLEAAVHGKPVVFGPVFNQYREAIGLLEEAGAFTVDNALDLENILDELLTKKDFYEESASAAERYVFGQQGATENIMRFIQENRLLIN